MEENKDEAAFSIKLEADNVWDQFNCPKYVACPCPETGKLPKEMFDFHKDLNVDTSSILQKLSDLISDPVTNSSVIRICRLLYEYLHKVGNNGYQVKDLPLVIKLLEFLAQNVSAVTEYELHLDRMLELCNIPPLLEKFSDGLIIHDIIKQYFTLLGHLLEILPAKQQSLKIHQALNSLLLKRKTKHPSSIKLQDCRTAMEMSELPITVTQLLQASSPDTYQTTLELVFLLSSISCICSQRMLEANVLNTILIRMDLPYATQLNCTRPPDILLPGSEYNNDTTLLIMDTLWSLMKCIIFPNNVSINLEKHLKSPRCALWGLYYAFKRQVFYSQRRSFSKQIRNEIAVIILLISIAFPSWNLVSSGIAEVVIRYLAGMECGTVTVFSETVKFGRSNEDLYFAKTLLLIIVQMIEIDACIYLMKQEKLMLTILQLVNPNVEKSTITWGRYQFWDLWTYAINVLSILTPKIPEQFLEYNGCARLYMLLEWCLNTETPIDVIMTCARTICAITQCNNKRLLECFREYGIVLLLIKLINNILKANKIATQEQRILTLALISVEKLMTRQMFYQEMYGEYSVIFITKLLFQCFYQKNEEFQVDQRLLLAIGSYIWECIVWCPKVLQKFIEYGSVYTILDIIESTPYYSRCLFLAVLTDICENYFCGPFLCTWRQADNKTGFMSLLANMWREEEIRIKAKRNPDGTIKDEELPQIGNKQWFDTYYSKLVRDVSPAIEDMIGSVRSKIYSICKIIERDSEQYELAKERYKMMHADLSVEDKITISTIELYFTSKLGQVWVEVSKYFDQVGINLLGVDSQALDLMTQRYYLWGSRAKEGQMKIIESIEKQEDIREKDAYARIRDSKLVVALDAFDELDYIYRTTNKSFMVKRKVEQIRQVNKALNFPHKSEDMHCHRTFQDKVMVTVVFNQHQTISSGLRPDINLSQMKLKLPLISPCGSYVSYKAYNSDISLPSFDSICFAHVLDFPKDD